MSPMRTTAHRRFGAAAIERYPRQLHEMERSEYLAMKRMEYARQQPKAL